MLSEVEMELEGCVETCRALVRSREGACAHEATDTAGELWTSWTSSTMSNRRRRCLEDVTAWKDCMIWAGNKDKTKGEIPCVEMWHIGIFCLNRW